MTKKVLVELFTLDSKGCAACTYTKETVERVVDMVDDIDIEIIEYPIKDKAAVKLMKERGVTSIPTICIDGEIAYESILPEEDELIEKLREKAK